MLAKCSPAAMPDAAVNKKTRFTAAARNRFASNIKAMAHRRMQELREQEIRNIVEMLWGNPDLIPGCQAFLASGDRGVKDELPVRM